LISDNEVLE